LIVVQKVLTDVEGKLRAAEGMLSKLKGIEMDEVGWMGQFELLSVLDLILTLVRETGLLDVGLCIWLFSTHRHAYGMHLTRRAG
jgi:hypothetical protein